MINHSRFKNSSLSVRNRKNLLPDLQVLHLKSEAVDNSWKIPLHFVLTENIKNSTSNDILKVNTKLLKISKILNMIFWKEISDMYHMHHQSLFWII